MREVLRAIQRHRGLAALLAASAAGLLAAGGYILWDASRVLESARIMTAKEGSLEFTPVPLERRTSAVEYLPGPASIVDFAEYSGRVFAVSPAALVAYESQSGDPVEYRTGEWLPPAPLTSVVTATVGSAGPELWIGTLGEGLIAFDGQKFRQVRPKERSYRQVTALLPLRDGRLLIGTERSGVLAFDGETLRQFHPSLQSAQVAALAGDSGGLWIGTVDRGLLHWHGGRLDRFDESNGLPDRRILSIAIGDGSVYAGTAVGIAVLRDGKVQRTIGEGIFARAILPDGSALWVGTQEDGVQRISLEPRRRNLPLTAGAGIRQAVHALRRIGGRVIAAGQDGLYAAPNWEPFGAAARGLLSDRNVSALAVDTAGNTWIGYFDRGLDIAAPGFQRVRHFEDERLFCINRVALRPSGEAAVATANGLLLFDAAQSQRQVLSRLDGLISGHVTDVVLADDRMVAATPAGVTFLGMGAPRSIYAFHGLVNNHVYALGISGGAVLAGTLGGLSLIEQGTVRASYTTANSALKQNWITAIVSAGGEWFIGSYGAGVAKLDREGHWQTFADAGAPIEINPNAMHVTAGHVYAGTLGHGLLAYDRAAGRWSRITAGLPSLNVTAVASGAGYLVVGTDLGLVRWKESER